MKNSVALLSTLYEPRHTFYPIYLLLLLLTEIMC